LDQLQQQADAELAQSLNHMNAAASPASSPHNHLQGDLPTHYEFRQDCAPIALALLLMPLSLQVGQPRVWQVC
jgi:hypothetical protein